MYNGRIIPPTRKSRGVDNLNGDCPEQEPIRKRNIKNPDINVFNDAKD